MWAKLDVLRSVMLEKNQKGPLPTAPSRLVKACHIFDLLVCLILVSMSFFKVYISWCAALLHCWTINIFYSILNSQSRPTCATLRSICSMVGSSRLISFYFPVLHRLCVIAKVLSKFWATPVQLCIANTASKSAITDLMHFLRGPTSEQPQS